VWPTVITCPWHYMTRRYHGLNPDFNCSAICSTWERRLQLLWMWEYPPSVTGKTTGVLSRRGTVPVHGQQRQKFHPLPSLRPPFLYSFTLFACHFSGVLYASRRCFISSPNWTHNNQNSEHCVTHSVKVRQKTAVWPVDVWLRRNNNTCLLSGWKTWWKKTQEYD